MLVATLQGVAQAPLLPADVKVDTIYVMERVPGGVDSLGRTFILIEGDTLHTSFIPDPFAKKDSDKLTAKDYKEIAEELGVEVAAIRAIVDIETGKYHKGLYAEGKPVINFDLALFQRALQRRGVNLGKYSNSPALQKLNIPKYGSLIAAQQARLDAAMEIDSVAAIESTFWGMFQIGGFNWKLCGAKSRQDFVELMSKSEFDQLRLFSKFIVNTGLVDLLRTKNWSRFARLYNGPSYATRGYHTRLAAAYKKFSEEERREIRPPLLAE